MVRIIVTLFLAVCAIAGVVCPAYAQNEPQQATVNSTPGEVVSVDLTKAAVEVKHITDPVTGASESFVLAVSPETKISRGEAVLGLADLKAGDKVTVDWVDDEAGNPAAKCIVVE